MLSFKCRDKWSISTHRKNMQIQVNELRYMIIFNWKVIEKKISLKEYYLKWNPQILK